MTQGRAEAAAVQTPPTLSTTYTAILDALTGEVRSAPEVPAALAWHGVLDRFVAFSEMLLQVPEPAAMPNALQTASAMLDRITVHAGAGDAASALRWMEHLERLADVVRRMAAVGR